MSSTPRTIASGPVSANEADAAFAPLGVYDTLVLAISGGSDSMALLELISDWRARRFCAAPRICLATVDHQLRAESRAEAEIVATRSGELGFEHSILEWRGAKPASGKANAAREARYGVLFDHASRVALGGSCAVVTAHTQDDQAETFVMRLARGSGVDGLAAMAASRPLRDGGAVMLARPLLGIAKARLVETLVARQRDWREDPSNQDVKSERVRVRRQIERLAEVGVSAQTVALTARRMGDASAAIDYADATFTAALSLEYNDNIFASFNRSAFDAGPVLLRQRLLTRLIGRFGGETRAPALAEIEALTRRLASDRDAQFTLGGAVISVSSQTLKVWREAGRMTACEVALQPDSTQLWDNRFWLQRNGRPDVAVIVRPLGPGGLRRLSANWQFQRPPSRRPPSTAVAALPAFWVNDELVAAPTLADFNGARNRRDLEGLRLSAIAATRGGTTF